MSRSFVLLALACTLLAGCGSGTGPSGPTPNPSRISRTKFLAFGDSFTAGEVTNPTSALPSGIHKLILVPAVSYPTQLQSQLRTTYASQAASITVTNGGEPGERILDGNQRFPGVFEANRPEVVLLMEGVNGLPLVGPDISTGVMRIMVQTAKNGGARVFVGSMIPQVAGRPRGTTAVSELQAYNNTLQLMSTQEGRDLRRPVQPDAVRSRHADRQRRPASNRIGLSENRGPVLRGDQDGTRRALITNWPRNHRSTSVLPWLVCYFRDTRWTRQFVNSPISSSFSLRQSIELASPNSLSCLPADPNLPTTLPSSVVL